MGREGLQCYISLHLLMQLGLYIKTYGFLYNPKLHCRGSASCNTVAICRSNKPPTSNVKRNGDEHYITAGQDQWKTGISTWLEKPLYM